MKRITFLFILIFLGISLFSFADDYYWIDPSGGELGDSTKWNPTGTPGLDDYVYFTEPGSYTVWLDDYHTHDRMTVDGSDLTLDLNSYEYTLDTTNDYNRSVVIGDSTTGSVTISGGGVYSRDLFMGSNGVDSEGQLHLSGYETFWTGYIDPDWHGFFFGSFGDAVISVTDNAYLEHGHGQSAVFSESVTTFDVDGQDSEWFVAGFFGMSIYGITTTNVSNGGRARMGYLEMALFQGSSSTINVMGTGHETELAIENGWWDDVSLYIGVGGTGVINLTGSILYHEGNTVIAEQSGSSGQLNIFDGSWADCQGSVSVGGSLDTPGGRGLISLYDNPDNGDYAELTCAWGQGESLIVWPDGTIRMDGGQIAMEYDIDMANPIDLRGGTLEGSGLIWANVNNYSGVVTPGSVGEWKALEMRYDYTQDAGATLKIPIIGSSSSSYWNYGGIIATTLGYGQVTLDGMLDVDLWSGFVPDYTDEYVIIEARSVNGQFINAASAYVFEGGTFEVVYEPDRVILTHFESQPLCAVYSTADFNKDCMVNLADFATIAEQWLDCNLEPADFCPGEMPM